MERQRQLERMKNETEEKLGLVKEFQRVMELMENKIRTLERLFVEKANLLRECREAVVMLKRE